METNELKITISEGQEIDWQESAKREKIVFKKKDTKPRSWKKYLCSGNHPSKLWFIDPAYKSANGIYSTEDDLKDVDLNESNCYMGAYLPSKELAEAFLAMMQLMSLRQAWIGGWEPDYNNTDTYKWYIIFCKDKFEVFYSFRDSHCLSFPIEEMAKDFMNTFKDLLNVARPLI